MGFEAHTLQILCPKPCNANQYSTKCNFKVALRALSYSKFYNSKAKKEQFLMDKTEIKLINEIFIYHVIIVNIFN